jgi:DNA-binding XRE family transcriptional regulator
MSRSAQTIIVAGKRFVILPEAEYRSLLGDAGEPALPPADAKGHRPALDYVRASIARDIIRERRALRLTRQHLAELAGVRQETLSRLESGKHSPTVRTVEKIDRALKRYAKSAQTATKHK